MNEVSPAESAPASRPDSGRPSFGLLLAVFCLAGCVLAMEVSLTRVFSAALKYHFTFLVISLAICGLGLGGMMQALLFQRRGDSLWWSASATGTSAVIALILFFRVMLAGGLDDLWMIAALVVAPFLFAGSFLASVFRRWSASSGRVYGADLLGSACAVPAVYAAMQALDPVNAFLLMGTLCAGVGVVLARKRLVPGALAAICAAVLLTNLARPWLEIRIADAGKDSDFRHLYLLMSRHPSMEIVETEWGPFARTDVIRDPRNEERLDFFINGTVPTVLLKQDPQTGRRAIPSGLLLDLPFVWRRPASVLTIGPGAGLDIVLAKLANPDAVVHGAEVNPAFPGLLEKYADFGGNPYAMPGVDIAVSDGRTYVARAERRYDMLVLALTKAGTGSVGSAMVECFLYTEEAVRDYLDALDDDGCLAFVTDNESQGWRFIHTVLAVLEDRGIPPSEGLDHLALVTYAADRRGPSPYSHLLLVGRSAFSAEDVQSLGARARQVGYRPQYLPGVLESQPFVRLKNSSITLDEYVELVESSVHDREDESVSIDLRPVRDDSPYFSDLQPGAPKGILPLVFVTLGLLVALSVAVSWRSSRARRSAGLAAAPVRGLGRLAYFSSLGMGFMAVEVPVIQKLILLLGHPIYALTVALFSILLGASAGSMLSQRFADARLPRTTGMVCAAAAALVGVVLFSMQGLTDTILALELPGRMLSAGLICALLGIAMGMPFPLGIRLAGRGADASMVPWIWGVNGLASVLGGLLTALGSKLIGFQAVVLIGASMYLVAAACARLLREPDSAGDGPGMQAGRPAAEPTASRS